LYIDDPEVLKSPGADNTFIIFGEAKIQDFGSGLAQQEASQFAQKEKPVETKPEETAPKTETKPDAGESKEDLSEEGLDPTVIETVVNHTKCTRAQAIKALRETGGDSVTAIIVNIKNYQLIILEFDSISFREFISLVCNLIMVTV